MTTPTSALHIRALERATETYARGGIPADNIMDIVDDGAWFGRGIDTPHGRRLAAAIAHDANVSIEGLIGALGDRVRRRREDEGRAIRAILDAAARGVGASADDLASLRAFDTDASRKALAQYEAAMAAVEPRAPLDVQTIGFRA